MIRRALAGACIAFCLAGCAHDEDAAGQDDAPIIPVPNGIAAGTGAFRLQPSTVILAGDERVAATAAWFSGMLEQGTGMALAVRDRDDGSSGVIRLELGRSAESEGSEGYRLVVAPESITVTGNAPAGLFYGAVSLWYLATAAERTGEAVVIPAMRIDDAPRFAWRGLMLDVARHHAPPAYIKQLIEWMALHKLNVLHWHLTDDQGWRLQIDALPRLTETGAWRTPAGSAAAADLDPATGQPRRYGGFYTHDEVRDIVAFAASRHVTVVPEIEMPGHAQAAIAAYPELGAGDVAPAVSADWGIHDYLFNVEEGTFEALEAVLSEVLALFPGDYIHVGGDEAVKDRWIASDRVQQRMAELGVADETALQSYFVKRIERFLHAHGRRLIGWDEILEGGIAPRATVMSWRGIDGALTAARLGHDTVLSPWPTLYFDHRQSALAGEPPGRGLVVTLEDVYRFDPMPPELAEAGERHVLGVQANVWTEHIRTPERVSYMTFPRAAALAEVAWSTPARRSWTHFVGRLPAQFERYRAVGIPFATSAFDLQVSATRLPDRDGVRVALSNQAGLGEIRYAVDGSAVTAQSAAYGQALELPADARLSAAAFMNGSRMSRVTEGDVGRMARRRYSHELELCSEQIVLSLEDDAPVRGDRSVFLVDIMNPCWIWPAADLSDVGALRVEVGQLPFNFQIGDARDHIVLREPATRHGELEVRAGECDGEKLAVLPLAEAQASDATTVLEQALPEGKESKTDLCFLFTAEGLDPMWAIDRVELLPRERQ